MNKKEGLIITEAILPPKLINPLNGETVHESFLHGVNISRLTIDTPEYFYQQPTPKQEGMFEEEYNILWKRLSTEDGVHVPQTIVTYFGKSEFIQQELHFRDLLKKYKSPDYSHRKDYVSQFESLRIQRKAAYEKLNSLTKKEVEDLRKKNTNLRLQLVNPHTGKMLTFSPTYGMAI